MLQTRVLSILLAAYYSSLALDASRATYYLLLTTYYSSLALDESRDAHLTLALASELGAAADRPCRAVYFRGAAARAVGAVAAGDRHGRRRRAEEAHRARAKALGTNLEW